MFCICTKFYIPISNGSVYITIKVKVNFRMVAMLSLYILQRNSLNMSFVTDTLRFNIEYLSHITSSRGLHVNTDCGKSKSPTLGQHEMA
jgi:hypothetical protein